MISSYDQPSNTEQIVRSSTRRRSSARPMTICVPGGIWAYDFIIYSLRPSLELRPAGLALRAGLHSLRSSEQSLPIHEFGIQYGCARGSANGIVAEHTEFVIENSARTDRADHNSHALASITIEARLRPLNVRFQMNHRPRSRRQLKFVDGRSKVAKSRFNLLEGGCGSEFHGNCFQVTIADVNTMGHSANAHWRIHKSVLAPFAENFQRFGLNLAVFAAHVD